VRLDKGFHRMSPSDFTNARVWPCEAYWVRWVVWTSICRGIANGV
jgi:hypothetical protein